MEYFRPGILYLNQLKSGDEEVLQPVAVNSNKRFRCNLVG